MPNIVNISYGQIDNINTEFNRNDIKKDDDKIEICDIDNEGITSNIRTVDILDVSNNEFHLLIQK